MQYVQSEHIALPLIQLYNYNYMAINNRQGLINSGSAINICLNIISCMNNNSKIIQLYMFTANSVTMAFHELCRDAGKITLHDHGKLAIATRPSVIFSKEAIRKAESFTVQVKEAAIPSCVITLSVTTIFVHILQLLVSF